MKKQFITVIISIAVLAVLLGVYYLARNKNVRDQEAAAAIPTATPQPSIVLTDRNKEELLSLTIEHADEKLVFLPAPPEKYKGTYVNWVLDGYEDITLMNYTVDTIISTMCYLSPSEEIDSTSGSPSDYGFDNPAVTVTARYADGGTDTLLVSMPTPANDYYYVMLQGDERIYLLARVIGQRFYTDMNQLIDKTLPAFDSGATYVYIEEKGKQPIECVYTGTKNELQQDLEAYGMVSLSMQQPFPGRDIYLSYFQESILQSFFEEVVLKDLVEIRPSDLSKYGLDDPLLSIILEDGYEQRLHFTVGNETEEDSGIVYVIENSMPAVFTMEKKALSTFYDINVFNFIDRFVALTKIDLIESISVSSSERGRSHELVLNHDVWVNDAGEEEDIFNPSVDGKRVQESAFRTFYQRLAGLAYDTEIPLFDPGDVQPLFTTVYRLNNGEDDISLKFYKYNDDFYAAQRGDDAIRFVVNKQSVDLMFRTMDDLVAGKLDK